MKTYRNLVLVFIGTSFITLTSSIPKSGCENEEGECRGILAPDYNPDRDLGTIGMIRRHGYPGEVHSVTTEDGYILQLHRIPHGRKRKANPRRRPVFLFHALVAGSADWTMAGPEIGLAYLLADRGYDVWMGNIRGNTYSRKHVRLNPDEFKFWNFSFHEAGIYDAPAFIDYVLNYTHHSKLSYIGHSIGTTVFYVMCSERPEYNKKIVLQISLAPVAYFSHMRSGTRPLQPIIPQLSAAYERSPGHGEMLSHTPQLNTFLKLFCTPSNVQIRICEEIVFFVLGKDFEQLRSDIFTVYLGQNPQGTSAKTLSHLAQLANTGTFRQFDYGSKNQEQYNSPNPPDYKISNIKVKIALFWGPNDPIAVFLDVTRLYSQLPNPIGLYRVNYSDWTHLDFIFAKDARPLLYYKLVDLLDSFN